MKMKTGDLVKPTGSCGGEPGAVRCKVAVVLETAPPAAPSPYHTVKAYCPCGSFEDYSWHFEKVEDAELTHSADPM